MVMAVESAKQDVQVSVGKDFVIMGTDRVEVSPDGKKVTAYTNDGVETKAASGAATQGISISADFNTVVMNGATIERAADGHLVISALGTVITKPGPANDTAAKGKTAPKIGDKMEDGTVYAGISPDTNKPMYATPADAPLTYTFNQAQKYAAKLDAHGHHDWHVPTKGELNVLFQNRAAIGGFDISCPNPAGWYWSSSPDILYSGWAQRFSDGSQGIGGRGYGSSLRCVR
jgi:hypothetical protein